MRWERVCLVVFLSFFLSQQICSTTFANADHNPVKPILKIAVLSDVHVMSSQNHWSRQAAIKFEQALKDLDTYSPDVTIINGDITNGNPEDYQLFKQIVQRHHPGLLFPVMGNHEYYRVHDDPNWKDEDARNLFISQFGFQRPYYDTYIHGYHFLFLASEKYAGIRPKYPDVAWLSENQLKWFAKKIKQPSTLKFVFLHQPLDQIFKPNEEMTQVVQSQALQQIAESNQPLLWFSGHTHDSLHNHDQVVRRNGVLYVGGGSTFTIHKHSLFPLPGYKKRNAYYETDTMEDSESRFVSIFYDHVIIEVRDHTQHLWLDTYRYRYNISGFGDGNRKDE